MAKNALPVYFRDPHTGFMKELPSDELGRISSAPARVLVADDDESDRLFTIWQLGDAWPIQEEVLVECAANGAEAMEKLRGQPYALVVLDWNMPDHDGGEVLRAMRVHNLRIPVVVVSSERREAIANELESMAAVYLHKDELDAHSFRNAITTSMQLQAGQSVAGSDPGPMEA